MIDQSLSQHTIRPVGSAFYDNTTNKYEPAATTSSYIRADLDSDDFHLSGDYTIELFGFEVTAVETRVAVSTILNTDTLTGWWLGFSTTGGNHFAFQVGDGATSPDLGSGNLWTPTTNTPYDVCVDISGTTVRGYIDGVMSWKTTITVTPNNSTQPLLVGRWHTGSSFGSVGQRMTALRLTQGVARYANDLGYTVPTLPLPQS